MMNISISLTPELVNMIKTRVASGRYTSTSEVVREALRLLEAKDEQQADERARLRLSWAEGIESNEAGLLDFTDLRAEARRRMAEQTKA